MSKVILIRGNKQIFKEKEFGSKNEAYSFAELNLSSDDYQDVFAYTKTEFQEELEDEMYIIVDWAYNIMFKGKKFSDADDAYEYANTKLSDEDLEDILVIQVKDFRK